MNARHLTVKELIMLLEQKDPDAIVYCDGCCEGCYQRVTGAWIDPTDNSVVLEASH